jgi:hypothetical protein
MRRIFRRGYHHAIDEFVAGTVLNHAWLQQDRGSMLSVSPRGTRPCSEDYQRTDGRCTTSAFGTKTGTDRSELATTC